MIEEVLINYGVLGVWTISLLWEKYKNSARIENIIKANTDVLTRINYTITKCQKK